MSLTAAVFLGFGLGVKHAIEADHLAAVCTMVANDGSVGRAAKVGALWGLGHGAVIMIAGGALVMTGASVPEPVALVLDVAVAVMLIGLGAAALRTLRKHTPHALGTHTHGHVHATPDARDPADTHSSLPRRPIAVGLVHGASGTAALTLLVASTITVRLHAIAFVVLFSLASIAGMALVAAMVAWPLRSAMKRAPSIERTLRGLAGAASIAAGLAVAWSAFATTAQG